MPDARRRKVPTSEKNAADPGRRRTKSSQTSAFSNNKLRFYFLTALVFTTCLLGFYLNIFPLKKNYAHNTNILDNVLVSLGLEKFVHSVVIDAGSTGSRVLAYTFIETPGEKSLKLHKEYFKELKPGLSAFASIPSESTRNLKELLEQAKQQIPQENWAKTPLVMKATAGLRLLPEKKADAILNEAKKLFASSGFHVTDQSVSIMDGVDEGLFSWFTVNFLLDRLGDSPSKTVVALDLGGGSTQISFAPINTDSLTPSDSKYLHKIGAFHQDLNIYTHSYLGLGLNEGRKSVLQVGNANNSQILKSECINPLVNTKWKHGGKEYSVQGPEKPHYVQSKVEGEIFKDPVVDFNICKKIVEKVVGHIDKPSELNERDIYAFSYYYDRAAESGLIDFKTGGQVNVESFFSAAKSACSDVNVDQPFMCLDLTFISVLLKDGFGLSPNTKINLVKWVDGHEVSWALGAAFHTLQTGL